MQLNYADLMTIAINLLFYFMIGFFGAFIKDLYDTMTNKEPRMRLCRMLIGAIWTAFLFIFLESTWLSKLNVSTIIFFAFISGILGFELFGNVTTLAKCIKLVETAIKIKKGIKIDFSSISDQDSPTEKKDDKEEKK